VRARTPGGVLGAQAHPPEAWTNGPKDGKGPSDPRAKDPRARQGGGKTYGGVDVEGSSKRELYERAEELGVEGRSNMSKEQLAEAIVRKQ
jgi:hypothetical protein